MIEIRNLNLSYPLYNTFDFQVRFNLLNLFKKQEIKKVHALKNINLDIKLGDRVALVGHNGSGKSTLLKTIAGIYYPDTGYVKKNDKVFSILNFNTGVLKHATGLENIYLSGYTRGFTKEQIEQKLQWIIDFSELKDAIYRPIRTYSSGMHIRLFSSLLLSQEPKIFLLDEFFGVGDASFAEKVRFQISKMIDRSGTFVFASHDETLLKKLCTRFVTLKEGKIISDRNHY